MVTNDYTIHDAKAIEETNADYVDNEQTILKKRKLRQKRQRNPMPKEVIIKSRKRTESSSINESIQCGILAFFFQVPTKSLTIFRNRP